MKSEIIVNKAIERLNLSTIYFSEGEILSRNIYKNTSFLIKDINIKDSNAILGKKIYVKLKTHILRCTMNQKRLPQNSSNLMNILAHLFSPDFSQLKI